MFHFRVFAIIVLGLLANMFFFGPFAGQGPSFESRLGSVILISLFILVLGPFWPSQENIAKWGRKSKLNLPTDNPAVAIYVANFLGALYSFYKAWSTYINPTQDFFRLEQTAFDLAGTGGVVVFWLTLAFICLFYGVVTYGKAKKA